MLDEETLATLVRASLEDVEVPADGPDRVLAARDGLASSRIGRLSGRPAHLPRGADEDGEAASVPSRRFTVPSRVAVGSLAAVVAVLIAVVAVTGTQSTSSSKTSATATAPHSRALAPLLKVPGPISAAPATPSASPPGALAPANGQLSNGSSAQSAAPGAPTVPAGPGANKVMQTGSLTLTVAAARLDATVARLSGQATGAGGQVAKSQTVEMAPDPYADLTLQVPSAAFASLVAGVRGLGAISAVTTSATDVTANYVDLQAQITALEAARQQFLTILAKAQTIGDILAVQAQITPLQTQIQQLQGQQQVLDTQTSTATLTVHVAVPGAPAPAPAHHAHGGLSGAWSHARHSFASGVDSVVAALGGIAVFLLCAAVVVLLGRLGWVVVRRRLA